MVFDRKYISHTDLVMVYTKPPVLPGGDVILFVGTSGDVTFVGTSGDVTFVGTSGDVIFVGTSGDITFVSSTKK